MFLLNWLIFKEKRIRKSILLLHYSKQTDMYISTDSTDFRDAEQNTTMIFFFFTFILWLFLCVFLQSSLSLVVSRSGRHCSTVWQRQQGFLNLNPFPRYLFLNCILTFLRWMPQNTWCKQCEIPKPTTEREDSVSDRMEYHSQNVSTSLSEIQLNKNVNICSPVGIFGCRPGVKLEENYTHGCSWRISSRQTGVITNEELERMQIGEVC